jgi:hypothetical protein
MHTFEQHSLASVHASPEGLHAGLHAPFAQTSPTQHPSPQPSPSPLHVVQT